MKTSNTSVEKLYHSYGTKLYSIALEIAPNQAAAEKILIGTFVKIHRQQSTLLNTHSPPIYITLIKLILQTAHEQLYTSQLKYNFTLKQFANTPLLNKLICEQISLENYCTENQLTRADAAKKIREELMSIRNSKHQTATPLPKF
ncbi:hypothetical protein [Haliscomenobacter hydrossis]|uniref:Uncharacterized protein n=1 Tax=Haliscomenobacter hydrossis (strain ATCC 27775 / DSM 1100 / LMG 10767 / O) TaxID=760192 RepID=F4KUR4_HALH1|nr:hypothetical protein [Haliscomenobacter hydrossis]AEE53467.1 hypothetical protein Halhy_5644 [Haliscomenobacter hydrossis DSM 1100]